MAGKELTLLAVGDVLVRRPVLSSIFDGTRDVLRQADLLVGNLEGATTDRGTRLLGKSEIGSGWIRAKPPSVPALAAEGFTAMSIANNHMLDYGPDGLLHTIELLREHGIGCVGGGEDYESARRPLIMERNGLKIAMLGYTSVFPPFGYAAKKDRPGVATVKVHTAYQAPENVFYQPACPAIIVATPDQVELEALLADVRRAKQSADLVLVQIHWGVAQGYGRVSGYMKELGRAMVDAGADLILGHHPHVLLGFEFYRERLICYSLNHFAFDIYAPWQGWFDTVILKAVIRDGRFARLSVFPVAIDEQTINPALADGARRQDIHSQLAALSSEFGTGFTPAGAELVLDGPLPGTPPPLRAPEVLADSMLHLPYPTSRHGGLDTVAGLRK